MLPKCDYHFGFKYPQHIKTMANRYILTILFCGTFKQIRYSF
nr:MAG TPA: hypothetical protein [Bacteriophage sp.]